MLGILGFLVVFVVVCVSIATRGESSSRDAQRRHDEEYAPANNVYVVLQTNNYYDDNRTYDNRSITVQAQGMPLIADRMQEIQQQQGRRFVIVGEREEWYDDEQEPTVGTYRTEGEQGYERRYLPRRRQAYRLPG